MEYIVKGRHVDLNDKIKEYSEKKIKNRIEKFLDQTTRIEVEFKIEKNPRITENRAAEITVFASGSVIRVAEAGTDFFEAIDKAAGKLERQVKKYRDKLINRGRRNHNKEASAVDIGGLGTGESKNIEDKIRDSIVKTKTFTLKPISPEEAVIQMELIGHDFFVFINSETERTAVIYRRKDSNYGLIEPTI
jgi:putative sigma-54 modulation protein